MTDRDIEVLKYLIETYPFESTKFRKSSGEETLKSALSLLQEHKDGKWVRKESLPRVKYADNGNYDVDPIYNPDD